MIETQQQQQYSLHLTGHFYWYDHTKSGLSYEFEEGAVVTDANAIARLEEFGAPVERIFLNPQH
ncbi:hypothetical protein SAMN05443247_06637 [Bradyrhizobium erythrophlei]|nr:hypothetical protein SAMN05443247_06637 [Bradyrhizobium erythrophlei]